MKKFFIKNLNDDIDSDDEILSSDPMDIINYLTSNPHINRSRYYISLVGADLSKTFLSKINLYCVNLSRANLIGADLEWVNLSGANLTCANLTNTNLKNVDLFNTIGDGIRIKTLDTHRYKVNMYDDRLQIGCRNHSKQEWLNFNDEEIYDMDDNALGFWREWKPKLITMGWL